jgi:hypothetical protein
MRFLLFTFWVFFSLPSAAQGEECFGEDPVHRSAYNWDLSQNARADFYLPTSNTFGSFQTAAAAHFEWNGALEISFDYQLPPGQVGLAYNVHRLVVEVGEGDDKFTADLDFTAGCTDVGRSFFPGESLKLFPIKVPPRGDGRPRGEEAVRVQLWGHL